MKETIFFLFISGGLFAQYVNMPVSFQEKVQFYERAYEDAGRDIKKLKGSGAMPFFRYKKYLEERLLSEDSRPMESHYDLLTASWARKNQQRSGPTADWKSVGPNKMHKFGGRVSSHAFDPVDPNTIYVGSATGGLWKTTNRGESWFSVTDFLPSTGVGGVAVNPKDPQHVVIGTGEGYFIGTTVRPGIGIFISYDGGKSWSPTDFAFPWSQGVSVLKIAWDPVDTKNVYAAATNGTWVSRDGGSTWKNTLAVGIADDVVANPVDNNIVYTVIENDGIYKSEDYGESWKRLDNGLPFSGTINFGRITLCQSQPQVLYTSLTDAATLGLAGLFKSEDHGASWVKLEQTPNAFCPPPPFNYGCQGFYDNAVAVSPTDPDLVFIGGITFWRSDNGGRFWTQHDTYKVPNRRAPNGLTFVDHHDIGFSPHDPSWVFSFSDGGVAISTDGGMWWDQANEGMRTAQFYDIASSLSNPDVLIGGMQDHGLQATDLGEFEDDKWIKWGDLDGGDVAIHPLNEDIFYGTWIDGQYLKTLNGTGSWQTYFINSGIDQSENTLGYFNPMVIHPTNGNKLLTATPRRIYSTSNGDRWTPRAAIADVKELAYDWADPSLAYAASYNIAAGTWGFWRSEDEGKTWSATISSPGWRVKDIITNPQVAGEVYACRNSAFAGNPHIFKSTDKGDSWTSIQGNLPDITVNDLAINHFQPNIIYAATDLGVYITLDGGEYWELYTDGMPISICYSMHYNPSDSTLVVGTIGRSAWKTRSVAEELTSTHHRKLQGDITVFPNPGGSETKAVLNDMKLGAYEATLWSIDGRQIRQFEFEIKNGYYELKIGEWLQQTTSGTYILKLRSGTKIWTERIQKI